LDIAIATLIVGLEDLVDAVLLGLQQLSARHMWADHIIVNRDHSSLLS
jgi:hypothetical protein